MSRGSFEWLAGPLFVAVPSLVLACSVHAGAGEVGACCLSDGSCTDGVAADVCAQLGGTYQGDGTMCLFVSCPPPTGACCLGDGSCSTVTWSECTWNLGGAYQGDGTDCATTSCDGACCLADGSCAMLSADDCVDAGGAFQGFGAECASTFCGSGACVLDDGSCSELTRHGCDGEGGMHLGAGTTCGTLEVQIEPYFMDLGPNHVDLPFERFDERGGRRELRAVRLGFDGAVVARLAIENGSPAPVCLDDVLAALGGTLSIPAVDPSVPAFGDDGETRISAPPGTCLCPDDGVPGSGCDFYDFGEVTLPLGAALLLAGPDDDLSFFVGDAPFTLGLDGTAVVSLGSSIPFDVMILALSAAGDVNVVYEFSACLADVDGSGAVDFGDVLVILSEWGTCPMACDGDVDGDGEVGFADLLEALSTWGPCA